MCSALLEPIPALSLYRDIAKSRAAEPRLAAGPPTVTNRIGDTAVLEYRPTETLPLLSAMLPDLARLCLPCRLASTPHRRKTRAFLGTKAKSVERRTVCWREMDSNFQYASTVRWQRATDLPLPPTVKRRSQGARLPWRDRVPRRSGFREAGQSRGRQMTA